MTEPAYPVPAKQTPDRRTGQDYPKRLDIIRKINADDGRGLYIYQEGYNMKLKSENDKMMWAFLIHLGYNMWREEDAPYIEDYSEYTNASDTMRFNKETWDEIIEHAASAGINTLIIDIGEGVRFESHHELAAKGAWSVEYLQKELERIRSLGITPVPKLNFSTAHDEWLGVYSRCISSKVYYEVCCNIINEVIDIFGIPSLFHIGMDEETYENQKHHNLAIVRHGDLWWNDFYYFVGLLEKRGVRPWIWSDYLWNNTEVFLKKMPKSVLQSNWYYDHSFSEDINYVKFYMLLEENGFEQVPAGSNWFCSENFERTVKFCKERIAPERLKGFMQTVWKPVIKERKYRQFEAIDLVEQARRTYY